jgi:2-desacetyl-2-hydroxyethyl bacteriochlorophyllide A dehydrogenase
MKHRQIKEAFRQYKCYFPLSLQKFGTKAWRAIEIPLGALLERRSIINGCRVFWPAEEIADFERARFLGPTAYDVVINVVFTLISPGTERAQLQGLVGTDCFPFFPGYSGCGEVVTFGKKVTKFRKGDRIAGRIPHSSPAVVQEQYLFQIPDKVSFEEAAFIELGIIVLQGIHKALIQPGESVIVLGQGLVGQLANRLGRLAGGTPIIAAARSKGKEKEAVSNGGADKFLSVEELKKEGNGDGFDIVIETTGDANIMPYACSLARKGGRVIGLGTPRGRGCIYLGQNGSRSGIRIIGAHITGMSQHEQNNGLWTYQYEGQLFLDLLAKRKLMINDLITQITDPFQANKVYESLQMIDSRMIGVLFDWRTHAPQR